MALQVQVGADGKPIAYLSPPGSPSAAPEKPPSDQGDAQTPQPTPQPVRVPTVRANSWGEASHGKGM